MRFLFIFLVIINSFLLTSCQRKESGTSLDHPKRPVVKTSVKSTLEKSYFLKHDFGGVDINQKLTCVLELKNDLDKALHFHFSKTSCGACLSVKSMPETIEPGEIGLFELEFDTTGKRGVTPQNAAFWDTEPKTVIIIADLTATVRSIWPDPEVLSLGNLSLSELYYTKLYIMAAGLPDAKVISAESEAPWITITSKPVATSEQLTKQRVDAIGYYEIDWTGKDAKPGTLSSKIIFHVQNGEAEQVIEVPVTGYLSGDVEIIPAQLVFGRVADKEMVRTCSMSFSKKTVDTAKIQCSTDHAYVKANLKNENGNENELILTVTVSKPDGLTDSLIEGNVIGKDESGEIIFSVPYIAFFDTE